MLLQDELSGPETDHQHQRTEASPSRQVGNQLHGGVVAPVQVLQQQQQGLFMGEPVDELAKLPEHAILRCAGRFVLQRLPVLACQEPGKLQQPGGRNLPHQRDQSSTVVSPAQSVQRL